jgi:hypothetical protein
VTISTVKTELYQVLNRLAFIQPAGPNLFIGGRAGGRAVAGLTGAARPCLERQPPYLRENRTWRL